MTGRPRSARPSRPDAVGQVLVVFGVLDLIYATYLMVGLTSTAARGLSVALAFLPAQAWALLWAVSGVVAIVSALLVKRRPPGPVGFSAAWLPFAGWAWWYLVGVVDGAPATNLVAASLFAVLAIIAVLIARLVDPTTTTSKG